MVLSNRYFKGVGSTQTSILVTIQCFTFCTTARNHSAMFVFFSFLWSLSSHCPFYTSLWNLQIADGNRFPWGNYHHFSFIRALKSSVLTMLIQKICYKGPLHLQKIVSKPFSANREPHTVIANLNIQKRHSYHHGCQGRKLQRKKLHFHKEKYWLDAVVAAKNLTYLLRMQVLQINWFSMGKLREAMSERETGLFITTRFQQFEEK